MFSPIDKDPCHPNPCFNSGACLHVDDEFVCNCSVGFKGQHCEGLYVILGHRFFPTTKVWILRAKRGVVTMDRLLKGDQAVEQYFTVVLFVFQFYQVCNFGAFIKYK